MTSIVAIQVFVNSTSENTEQADAIYSASDFVVEVYREIGKHTRTAVGVCVPHNIATSVYKIVEIQD